jgi:hypothetical protein
LRAKEYGPRTSCQTPLRATADDEQAMTPDRWQLIKDLFASALEIEEPARGAWLDDQCGDDEGLRVEVDSLLAAHTSPASTLDTPAKDRAGLGRLRLVDVLKEQQALAVFRKRTPSPHDEE